MQGMASASGMAGDGCGARIEFRKGFYLLCGLRARYREGYGAVFLCGDCMDAAEPPTDE